MPFLNFVTDWTEHLVLLQVRNRLRNVQVLHREHRRGLEARDRAIQVHRAMPVFCRQAEAAMAHLPRAPRSWLLVLRLLRVRGHVRGTHGAGSAAGALAEVQGRSRLLWTCPQLWKDMPSLSGVPSVFSFHPQSAQLLVILQWSTTWL